MTLMGELLEKVITGDTLTSSEQRDLKLFGNQIHTLFSWIDSANGIKVKSASFAEVYIKNGVWYLGSGTIGNASNPFSGVFLSSNGLTFGSDTYHLGGVNSGTLQFGLSATDGKAYFGGGAGIISSTGIDFFQPVSGPTSSAWIKWYDANDVLKSYIYDSTSIGGSPVSTFVLHHRRTSATPTGTLSLEWQNIETSKHIQFQIGGNSSSDYWKLIDGTTTWLYGDYTGIVVNEQGVDYDFRIEGDTDTSLFITDAGLDAIGMGGAAESGYKAKITGDLKVTGGITQAQKSQSVLGSSYSISSNNTWEATGLSVSLPEAGDYELFADARGSVAFTPTDASPVYWISVRLYDVTSASVVTNSERMVIASSEPKDMQATASIYIQYSSSGANTIRLEAFRNSTDSTITFTTAAIVTNTDGRTVLAYKRA